MTVHMQPDSQRRSRPAVAPRRRALRAGVVTAGVVLGSWVTAAVAAPPEGWDNGTNDTMLVSLLKLFGIPLLVIAVVTLLVYLPSMMRGGRGNADPATYFSEHSEWFGGPRDTTAAVEGPASAGDKHAVGGASARW